jgi:deoxyadenosine/deoxycytidine kinase
MIVSISGNIGAGKTSVLNYLRSQGECVFLEGHDRGSWKTILNKMYKNPKEYTYLFQTLVLADMKDVMVMADCMMKNTTPRERRIVWVERSCVDCIAFARVNNQIGNLSDDEMYAFDKIYNHCVGLPAVIVSLKTTVKTCMQRVASRGRDCEQHLESDYLTRIEESTGREVHISGVREIVIDTVDKSVKEISQEILERVKMIPDQRAL